MQGDTVHDEVHAWCTRLRERLKRMPAGAIVGGSIILFVYVTYVPFGGMA